GVIDLEFFMIFEIRECRVDGVCHHDKIDRFLRVVLADSERQNKLRHGQFLVRHPGRHLDNPLVMGLHVTRGFHRIAHAVEYRASNRFWPVHRKCPEKKVCLSEITLSDFYEVRAKMISASPTRKQPNMAAINRVVPGGAVRNSFQMNSPEKAATMVAPCPSP